MTALKKSLFTVERVEKAKAFSIPPRHRCDRFSYRTDGKLPGLLVLTGFSGISSLLLLIES